MRTSVEISDALLAKARKVIARRRVTLRALIEEGLRRVLAEERETEMTAMADRRFDGPLGFAPGRGEADVAEAIRAFNEGARGRDRD